MTTQIHWPTPRVTTELLGEEECLTLLAQAECARVGFVTPAGLQIVPAPAWLHGHRLYLTCLSGSMLAQLAEMGTEITAEFDDYANQTVSPWSVTVVGALRRVSGDELVGLRAGAADRGAERGVVTLVLQPRLVSGQRRRP
jgi:nitroimidazol reductase NimA-like FMN-containing flavoprotein (pyridoxamine 5'-phosphate oxidase superfamily)